MQLTLRATGPAVLNDRHMAAVGILAVVASIASFVHFYTRNLTTAFSDAESRLMIARGVVDGLHGGLAQLGGIWLPLQQAAMLPLVWNDRLYTSGVAGSAVSMLSYLVAVIAMYRLVLTTTRDKTASVVAAAAFSSPSILYMQSTPMSEILFIALFLVACYFLTRWVQETGKVTYLAATAGAVFLASLTRYEGWVLFWVIAAVIAYTCRTEGFGYRKTEGHLIYFGSLALFGVGLWLLWNQVIFGDVLYFARSEYSPAGLISRWQPAGTLLQNARTTGNLLLSVVIYARTALDTAGWLTCGLAAVGLSLFLVSQRPSAQKLIGLGLLFPLPFYVLSLFEGRTVLIMEHPDITGGSLNLRYGTLMLPSVAFFVGFLAHKVASWAKPVVLVLVVATLAWTWHTGIIALTEAIDNQANTGAQGQKVAAAWLKTHYDGGLILDQRNISEHLVFFSELPLRNFIYEGDQLLWQDSLENPARHARWVLIREDGRDKLWLALSGTPRLTDYYTLVYHEEGVQIYKLNDP
jgi:hypothetical protein